MIVRTLLIRAKDNGVDTHYRRGDVVGIFPYNQRWGTDEGLPGFVKIHVAVDTKEQAEKLRDFLESDEEVERTEEVIIGKDQDGNDITQTVNVMRLVRKRRWNWLVDNLPNAVRIKLRDTGEVSIGNHELADFTWSQAKDYLRRKSDNAAAEEL